MDLYKLALVDDEEDVRVSIAKKSRLERTWV